MRRFLSTILLAFVLIAPALARPASAAMSVSVSFFHAELEPYGNWVHVPSLGLVWRPDDVAPGWQPYLVGHWAYTDYGWTWVSLDPWDPWPYHYGTWVLTASYGWVWVPGTVWAPAWVSWYVTDRYVGWCPVAPTLAVNLSGVTHARYAAPSEAFVFVPTRAFARGETRSARVDPASNPSLLRAAESAPSFAVVDGVVRTRGPARDLIERRAGVSVRKSRVSVARVRPARLPDQVLRQKRAAPVVAPRSARDLSRPSRQPRERPAPRRESSIRKTRQLEPRPREMSPPGRSGSELGKPSPRRDGRNRPGSGPG